MSTKKQPLKVFLSYASQDRPAVQEIYDALKLEDWIDPWIDKAKIRPGEDWQLVIETAVDEADVVIVCLSNQSVPKEGYVQKEIRYAYNIALEKPDETIFLIPLRLDNCEIPRKLRFLHRVDYFGADKTAAYSDLVEALKLRYDQKLKAKHDHLARQAREMTDENAAGKGMPEEVEKSRSYIRDYFKRKKRVLEAAIEKQVQVNEPASLFVWIKRLASKSIVSVVSNVDEEIMLDEDNVKSKGLEIEFPVENGRLISVDLSLKLVAHDFTPQVQQKKISVPPEGDSEICTFIVRANKPGRLLLNLEVLKGEVSIANRSLHTTATESQKKEHNSMVLASIPIVVLVHASTSIREPAENQRRPETSPTEKARRRRQRKGMNPTIAAALIGGAITIIAALIPLFASRFFTQPTTTPTTAVTLASTSTDTVVITDTATSSSTPTFTLVPATDTALPTPTGVPPVELAMDWPQGCISTLWQPFPAEIPVTERSDGCWYEPVYVFVAENGDLDFLAEDRKEEIEIYGLFAPLPERGTVNITVRLNELTNVDVWLGIFAEPNVNSQGLLMTIPAGDAKERVIVQKDSRTNETITGTRLLEQGQGFSISFTFTANTAQSTVNPSVFVTDEVSIPSSQKWLFLGYKSLIGYYRIEGRFLEFELE